MKKYTNLLLVLLLILSCFITSCSKSSPDDNVVKNADGEVIEIPVAIPEEEAMIETEPEEPKEPEEEIIEYRTSFIGVGDNIIYGTKEARIKAVEGGRQYNYKPYYDGVSDIIRDADIAFINQETVMCGEGYSLSYYPMFNSPQELGYDLVELGFDVVNIANNHMLDKGADGLSKTISFWKSFDDIVMTGGYENMEDYDNLRYYEKDGLKIAFLSYAEMTNGLVKSASSDIVIPYLNEEDIIRQTAIAKENADLTFVSVHWGEEGAFEPNDNQKYYANLFADCGVDVILGHHPHVIQPVEWLTSGDGHKTLCVYSLGNFMAQQAYDYNMVGGIISFDIVHSKATSPFIENVVFNPTVFHFNSAFVNNNVYLFENYPPENASLHGVRGYYGHNFSYDRLLGYITNTIDPAFLPEFFKEMAE